MNHYYTSTGERISQATLDRRIRNAKRVKHTETLGRQFCEVCGSNDTIIDMAHLVSVQKCKNKKIADLAYDVDNIILMCRPCHKRHDGL